MALPRLVTRAIAGSVNGGASVTTAAIDTTGVTFLLVAASFIGTITLTDSQGNTWVPCTKYTASPADAAIQFFYCVNPTTNAAHTFTITGTGAAYPSISVTGWDDVDAAPFDAENGASQTSNTTSHATGSITPADDALVVVANSGGAADTGGAIDSLFMSIIHAITLSGAQHVSLVVGYGIAGVGVATNVTFSFPTSGSKASTIAAFRTAGSIVGTPSRMVFNRGALGLLDGTIDWSGDTIKARLSRTSETLSKDALVMTGLGLSATDTVLTGKTGPTENLTTDRVSYDAFNTTHVAVAAGAEIDKVILFKFDTDDAGSTPIAVIPITPITPTGADITVSFDPGGMFYLQQ